MMIAQQPKINNQALYKKLALHAAESRQLIINMLTKAKSSHLGCALSVIDILTVLYQAIVDSRLIKEKSERRDYIILSKGHAASALYAALIDANILPRELADNFYEIGSQLAGHPIKGELPGIESSTGSLGHGLPIGVGMALSLKNDGMKNRIFVIVGDGECQEGSVWEALMFANRYKLNNLTIIVDYNKLQAFDRTQDLVSLEFAARFKAFGCFVSEIDGHNYHELFTTLVKSKKLVHVIIAHTVKGKGISFAEDKLEWHYKSLNEEQYKQAQKELESSCAQ